ncbi:MAG: sulfatase-like hydrolase/transferase [Nitrospira sp. SB0666_bin_27]|nr:sulfatase-like hydrolase/transferase [Nitrospira sp. SB0666_bin_27]MYF24718.1 sulfatase-like hydrolase/transferase [Nitrospira sp. SB0678_bin_10]
MNSGSVFEAVLIAINVVTLSLMVPLNSHILAHPFEPVCISCLLTVYGGGILVAGFSLFLANWWGGEKIALRVQKFLTVIGIVSFLHLIQLTMVPSGMRTLYVIVCVVMLAPAVIGFLRGQKKTVILVHQFFFLLFLYEVFNFGRVMLQAREVEANIESTHDRVEPVALDEDGHHVFWIIFDEFSLVQSLERDKFDVNVVPNLATFSRTSTWYPYARTLFKSTERAIPALLLGKKDVTDFKGEFLYDFNSQNYLSSIAQNMEVFIVGNYLPYCHAFKEVAERCRVYLEGGFTDYVHLANSVWRRSVPGVLRDTKAGRKLRRLILLQSDQLALQGRPITRTLSMGQSFDHPTFTFIHEGLPHFPYRFKSNGDLRQRAYDGGPLREMSRDELEEMQQFYREQVTYTDSLFGEFVAQLKAKELYDQSYIVIMSDHGISFDPLKPGRHLELEQVARVPFLLKSPGQTRGVVNPQPVHTAEFFEILLDEMEKAKPQIPAT